MVITKSSTKRFSLLFVFFKREVGIADQHSMGLLERWSTGRSPHSPKGSTCGEEGREIKIQFKNWENGLSAPFM